MKIHPRVFIIKIKYSDVVNPVHVGRALESLRNSNFNTVSAMGEVIDNSLEANAKNIKIKIQKKEIRKNVHDLTEIAFGDDGKGMDKKLLHQCLQLGFSERYNERKGIGRFGVGMTLGAITQCTRIEVYSKPSGGNWNLTYLDLDEIKNQTDPIIPEPVSAEIPAEYAHLTKDHGTLLIWKNWDREDANINEMIEWIGRTYRKFIGADIIQGDKVVPNPNQIHISIDDEEISAFDPTYAIKTKYNSETAQLMPPITITEEIHSFDSPKDKKHGASEITITLSLLPESWRPKSKVGASDENKKRKVNTNEGISILRNGREVFYGHIPYFNLNDKKTGRGFLVIDRYWGCEISFNAELDHWFSVKNIKVGARPLPELRQKIEDASKSTIYEFRKEIRRVWAKLDAEKNAKTEGTISGTDDAEHILMKNNPITTPVEEEEINQVILDSGEKREPVIEELKIKMGKQPYSFVKSDLIDKRGNFMDLKSRGETSLITLNMNHPFFQKFFDIITNLKLNPKDDKLEESSKQIETIFYLLMGSFAKAQREFNPDQTQTAQDFIEKLMRNWTYELERNADSISKDD